MNRITTKKTKLPAGAVMSSLLAFIVLASVTNVSPVPPVKGVGPITQPVFLTVPKPPEGLTLYDTNGEVVARCGKKDDSFANCKMEPGVTLDDLMNAWVHAYQDTQK
jgi:hypothetical protein